MTKFNVIVNLNLEYSFDVESEEEARGEFDRVELPPNYISGSSEVVKVIKEE